MQDRVRRILEYDKMKDQLIQHAGSSLGKNRVKELMPYVSLEDVQNAQQRTQEAAKVIRLKGQAPLGGLRDIRAAMKRSEIGGQLNEQELIDVSSTIYSSRRFKLFVENMVEDDIDLTVLPELVQAMEPPAELEKEINQAIDENGGVLDSASQTLRTIRQQIRSYESAVRSKLENVTRSQSGQKMLSDAIITIRNDRFVLPVKAEYRSHFGGIVHDQSASGQTLFIEPESVVDTNNQLREARVSEKREIERILQALSAIVAEHTDALGVIVETMTEADFMFAKAFYSHAIHATEPDLNSDGHIDFREARHPLIPSEEVVAIDISLGDGVQSLVITGPNTGGKTVTLKTVGLLSMMAQSGLHIPCQEGSTASVFQNVFADIGDEQSIEQSLSTFSSHMTTIVDMMARVDHQSLVLLDELGAGTDPTEGAALAVSILDHLYNIGAKVIATTHYSELKGYAYNREGVSNASVEFDVETLQPTYRLLMGVPGRSNAFAISTRLGLQEEIIEAAKAQLSQDTNKMEHMISSLEDSQKQYERELDEAERLREEAEAIHSELTKKMERFEEQKEKAMAKAEEKAAKELEKTKTEAELIIAELREKQQQNPAIKDHELIDAKKRLSDAEPKLAKKPQKKQAKPAKTEELKPGDEVKVISFDQKGQIVEKVNDKEFYVQLGVMKMKVKNSDLEYLNRPQPVQEKPLAAVRGRDAHVKTELDLRGERYESAIMEVEKYLDDAVLAGYHQVSIIHGKGTGALRKGVQEYLQNHKNVQETRMGTQGEGGSGVTVVVLK
ncbi:endonuclease MutS2 [Salisediminibacterium halotolerans]|uniref:endonuclease MutS2 n=1 Tax=Salisediminibacterium halotolerans TaxID=517425 RepID=UPI000EAE77AA|nr:endonuclease MutS2 [Salisediminibacterium halotolerans]RLJ69435.1 DNA mismatch repair protein MutS2 [Actinophytocola xinjiangensis]RPE84059.1 DNA mismatch repair protein MutS2 [Salisediminibacterium halotolerans]TWG32510.1 DNA mismatch repair protein MutS2 [Salisediminibacterium halotolerans]GEL09045.1 endonuclease MutS2 [Salisediminibacterium halotolerans]